MTAGEEPKRPAGLGDVGRRMDDAFQRAAQRVEEETERLITYLNDEVVPAAREHSSRGLRKAAERLSQFADYLESRQQR